MKIIERKEFKKTRDLLIYCFIKMKIITRYVLNWHIYYISVICLKEKIERLESWIQSVCLGQFHALNCM